MHELVIEETNDRIKLYLPITFFIALFFPCTQYLHSGFSHQTLITSGVCFLIFSISLLALYTQSKHSVIFNIINHQITVSEMSLLGKMKRTTYDLNDFAYVRSFITQGKGAVNCVELVTHTENWGLIVTSFLPCGGKRFFTLVTETENPKAQELCESISKFTSMPNKGFQGHQFSKTHINLQKQTDLLKNLF